MTRTLTLTLTLALLALAGCDSCSKKDAAATAPNASNGTADGAGGGKPPPREFMPSTAPPPGSDADRRRIEALDLAVKIDGGLAELERGEQPLQLGDGKERKADAWITRDTPAKPRKIVVATTGDQSAVGEVTDYYYDDKGRLAFARAPDGLFIFENEQLSVWLDREQKVKRGINPSQVQLRVAALTKEHRAALTAFKLR